MNVNVTPHRALFALGICLILPLSIPRASLGQGVPSEVWHLKGNRGSDPAINFLGTTDYIDLVFRTNNLERLRILANGDINLKNSLSIGLDLNVGRDGFFGRNLSVGNNLNVTNNGTFGGSLGVTGNGVFGGSLNVTGSGAFGQNLSVGNNLTVLNSASIANNLNIGQDLFVQRDGSFGRNVSIGNSLNVTKDGSFGGSLTLFGAGTFKSTLDVAGNGTYGGSLTVTGDGIFKNNLAVTGDGTFSGGLNVTKDGTFGGSLNVNGDGTVGGSLNVTKDGIFGGSLNVTKDGSFGGNVSVGGILDLKGPLHVKDTTQSTSTSTGALIVDGGAGIAKNLNVGGIVNVSNNLSGSSDDPANFALQVHSNDQGISVQLQHKLDKDGGDLDHKNNFVSFWDPTGKKLGAIQGQTNDEWAADPGVAKTIADTIANGAAAVAFGIHAGVCFVDVCSATADAIGALLAGETAISGGTWLIIGSNNHGVAYSSGAGDYAEYLPRRDEKEKISAGDIVGVYGGRVTRKTTGAEQIMVVSTAPIVLGNVPTEGKEHLCEKVAFLGQVPVKVIGPVEQGDFILPSGLGDGTGVAVSPEMMTADDQTRVVGRAWESSFDQAVKPVRVVLGMNATAVAMQVKKQQDELISLKAELAQRDRELAALKTEVAGLSQLVQDVRQLEAELASAIATATTRTAALTSRTNTAGSK